ncbi:DNA primase small subunit [Yarrowia sp. C11]|nr:DNA primase small subunit [Yarrowia sp. E02]KAG5372875.1 DNA primase small subunit [Yarrowia sp. C11]
MTVSEPSSPVSTAEPPTDITVPPSSSPRLPQQGLYDAIMNDVMEHIEEAPSAEIPESRQTEISSGAPEVDFEGLGLFYSRFFPFKTLHRWLNHTPRTGRDFAFREFAFTLRNGAYLRFNSFPEEREFKARVDELVPERFEIGAVYSHSPKDRKKLRKDVFKAVSKELVFDIDMDDYDKFRTCCSGASVCNKCWRYVQVAVKMVNSALREDFGYKHIMWVFSGRRGAHAWVSDKKARDLNDRQRSTVVSYIAAFGDATDKSALSNSSLRRPLHPHLQRCLDIATTVFNEVVLQTQDPWADEEGSKFLLAFIPDEKLRRALAEKWKKNGDSASSAEKWSDIDKVASSGVSANLDTKKLVEAKQNVILTVFMPKLDGAVSRGTGHLLKSPFCIHPKTSNVCVPMEVDEDSHELLFTPEDCPKLQEIIDDFNNHKEDGENSSSKRASDRTRLKPFVEVFDNFVEPLMKEEIERVKAANAGTMEF